MKYVFIAAIAAIIARGILGLISPAALNGRERPKPREPSAQVSTEGPPGTISGRVTDAETGESLWGASVSIEGTQLGDATDSDGVYEIPHVPTGKHRLIASYTGYEDCATEVALDGTADRRVDFRMATLPFSDSVIFR